MGDKHWWTWCLLPVFQCLICFIRSLPISNLSSSTGFTPFHILNSLLFRACRHMIFVSLDTGYMHFHLFKISKKRDIYFNPPSLSAVRVKGWSCLCLQPHGPREGVRVVTAVSIENYFSKDLGLDKVIGDEMALNIFKFFIIQHQLDATYSMYLEFSIYWCWIQHDVNLLSCF